MSAPAAVPRLSHTTEPARFDVEKIRAEFPILGERVHGRPLVYLDNAATSQKPNAVIEAIANYYRYDNANIHRVVPPLPERGSGAYDAKGGPVKKWIHA